VISFADNFSGQVNMLKDFRYGLYMGAFFVPLIGLLHIFPSNRSDDEIDGWIFAIYLATFLYYGTAGFLSVRRSQRVWDGVRIGAFTALLGVAFIIASFALFDNIFFATVSQQVDIFAVSSSIAISLFQCAPTLIGVIWMEPSSFCPSLG